MPKAIDITGQIFNEWKAIKKVTSKNGKTYWFCECTNCHKTKEIQTTHLRNLTCGHCYCMNDNSNNNHNRQAIFIEESKKCEICGRTFKLKNYGRTRKYCYECSPDSRVGGRSQQIIVLRRAMKREAIKRMGGKCMKCGYNKCIEALQFHHRDPSKKSFELGQNDKTRSWKDYWKEAQKCDLLCANCHAEEHWKINQQNNDL